MRLISGTENGKMRRLIIKNYKNLYYHNTKLRNDTHIGKLERVKSEVILSKIN